MHVPLLDLHTQYARHREEIDAAMRRVVEKSAFILGEEVAQFEEAFAAYCGARHAIGVGSGTAALFLALKALDIGPGDEVITTPFTFFATASTIAHTGATPVFADIDPRTYNVDPAAVARAVTPRTRAIVAVHLYGQPADMDALRKVAQAHNLWLIEDAAQAHGAAYKGQRAGTLGDIACFSFYPTKNLGGFGDGGAVVTNHDALAERVRLLRNHGQDRKYHYVMLGYGERLDALQAAVLRAKLPHLDQWNKARREAARRYNALLADVDLVLPYEAPDTYHVYHCYTVRVPRRDEAVTYLREHGVGVAIHYPTPLHFQPAFAYLGLGEGAFPVAEQVSQEVLSLPLFPEITEEQQRYVADTLKDFLHRVA